MRKHFEDAYPIEVQGKAKKNMVWIFIFSICMMFAGFTSAYIVSMGNSFWIKINLPIPFYISTVLIIISSLTMFLAVKALNKKNVKSARLQILLTLLLGIGFGISQFMGYSSLVKSGAHFVSHIIVDNGRYGDYYEIKKDGKYLTVINNQFYYDEKKLEGVDKQAFHDFVSQFLVDSLPALKAKSIHFDGFTLLYKGEPLAFIDGEIIRPNGDAIEKLDFHRLYDLSRNIVDDRADFFVRGEMGKDFRLFYNKNELEYHERTLMYKGKPLSANLQNKLLRGNNDTSTAYFYIITILHLLHVVAAVLMLIVMLRRSFTIGNIDRLSISVKAGGIFWHFLGILWIYLLLFLIFIH